MSLLSSTACFAQSYDIRFGVLVGDSISEETTVIPYYFANTGFRYGFTIDHNGDESYKMYSIQYLPKKVAKTGGIFEKENKPSKVVKTIEEKIYDNHAIEEFGFETGDPLGTYKVDLYINGSVVKSVTYKVVSREEYKNMKKIK